MSTPEGYVILTHRCVEGEERLLEGVELAALGRPCGQVV
jgi:hypothetical protein